MYQRMKTNVPLPSYVVAVVVGLGSLADIVEWEEVTTSEGFPGRWTPWRSGDAPHQANAG